MLNHVEMRQIGSWNQIFLVRMQYLFFITLISVQVCKFGLESNWRNSYNQVFFLNHFSCKSGNKPPSLFLGENHSKPCQNVLFDRQNNSRPWLICTEKPGKPLHWPVVGELSLNGERGLFGVGWWGTQFKGQLFFLGPFWGGVVFMHFYIFGLQQKGDIILRWKREKV